MTDKPAGPMPPENPKVMTRLHATRRYFLNLIRSAASYLHIHPAAIIEALAVSELDTEAMPFIEDVEYAFNTWPHHEGKRA